METAVLPREAMKIDTIATTPRAKLGACRAAATTDPSQHEVAAAARLKAMDLAVT